MSGVAPEPLGQLKCLGGCVNLLFQLGIAYCVEDLLKLRPWFQTSLNQVAAR